MHVPVESSATATPTSTSRVRYGVLGFACTLSMITYLDRVCMGSALSEMKDALGLQSVADLKWAVTAFAFAYAAFEIPSGWLGDVYGPRSTLVRIVLWWSVFTAITGLTGLSLGGIVFGTSFLIVVRFLFGMGEAGAYPNIARALYNWFPFTERGFSQGMVWMSGRLMGGLTPLIWMLLISGIEVDGQRWSEPLVTNWRYAFLIFGMLGLVWATLFGLRFRNRPSDHPAVSPGEAALISAGVDAPQGNAHAHVPWGKILGSRNLWILCVMYFLSSYGWYFNITYLPNYLQEHYDVRPTNFLGAIYKGGPLWMGAIGCLLGGLMTDAFIRRTGNRRLGRKIFGIIGHSMAGLCFIGCLMADDAFTFFLTASLAAFFNDMTLGSSWSTCQDIGGRYAAIAAGCMNTLGNMGGALAGWATGTVLEWSAKHYAATHHLALDQLSEVQLRAAHFEGYQLNFISYAVAYAIAVLGWLAVDATKKLVDE